MKLPIKIISIIEGLVSGYSINHITLARKELSELYRSIDYHRNFNPLITELQKLAYLIARFPATYAAVFQVFKEMKRRFLDPITSLLDVGAGPGTSFIAAKEAGLTLTHGTLIEKDPGFIKLGKKLSEDLEAKNWICADITKDLKLEAHDLVIASYSLGELSEKDRLKVLEKLWEATRKILIIVEPGTKAAFESLKKMREDLLLKGASLVAPCPHSKRCPMQENNWCHFSSRIERSSLHRKIKDATLNYEDEKFSYVIFAKDKVAPCQARIIRDPFKGKGFIKLQLCTQNAIEEKIVTKKNKSQFLYTRKIEWGDEFNFS